MRILLSNGDYGYTNNSNSRLVDYNDKATLVGENLYLSSNNNIYRLSIDSPTYLEEYYNNEWTETEIYIPSDSIPHSLNADDTFNFEGFGTCLVLTSLFAVFCIFNAFKK